MASIVAFNLSTQLVAWMSWVEGPVLCLLSTSFGKQFHNTTTWFCYAKIDDHGVRRGDTGQVLAQWWCPVASRVALDLPYWVLHLALYRLIHMAIKMAHEAGGAYFSVVNVLSCITLPKWPCYGRFKIKLSYTIVCNYALIYFVYYGGMPTAMYAVLALIANGGWVIVVSDREVVVKIVLSFNLLILLKLSCQFVGSSPDHGVRRSVATTANFNMEPFPNTLWAYSTHAWEQSCILHLSLIWFSKTLVDKWGVLVVGDAIISHPFSSPNCSLQVEITSQYFTGIFNSYIGTISILFRPQTHVVW